MDHITAVSHRFSRIMEQEQQPRSFLLDKTAAISLGCMVAVLGFAIGGTWQVSGAINALGKHQQERDGEFALRFQRIEFQLEVLQRSINTADAWRRADHREWASLLAQKNPSLVVPEVPR